MIIGRHSQPPGTALERLKLPGEPRGRIAGRNAAGLFRLDTATRAKG